MASLRTTLYWFGSGGAADAVTITDWATINIRKVAQSKSNSMTINLKNPKDTLVGTETNYKWINDSGALRLKDGDVFKFYATYAIDDTALDLTTDSSDLIFNGKIREVKSRLGETTTGLSVVCADNTFLALNKVFAFDFRASGTNNTAPEIIREVLQHNSDSNLDKDGDFGMSTKLFSAGIKESGSATSTSSSKLIDSVATFETNLVEAGDLVRNSTDETYAYVISVDSEIQLTLNKDIFVSGETYQVSNGFIQDTRPDGTAFPTIGLAKTFKPIYEWVEDLSQPEATNTTTEVDSDDPPCKRAFVFHLDERDRFHWFYPDNIKDLSLVYGTNTEIIGHNLEEKVFDVINMVIFRAGSDLLGTGITNYFFDKNTETLELHSTFRAWTDIATDLFEAERKAGNLIEDNATPGPFRYQEKRWKSSGYPITPTWDSSASIADNSAYNTAFRAQAVVRGKRKGNNLCRFRGSARLKGNIDVRGKQYTTNDLIEYTARPGGIVAEKIRIKGISHNFGKSSWSTTLNVEEDEKELGA